MVHAHFTVTAADRWAFPTSSVCATQTFHLACSRYLSGTCGVLFQLKNSARILARCDINFKGKYVEIYKGCKIVTNIPFIKRVRFYLRLQTQINHIICFDNQ